MKKVSVSKMMIERKERCFDLASLDELRKGDISDLPEKSRILSVLLSAHRLDQDRYLHTSQIASMLNMKKSRVESLIDEVRASCLERESKIVTNMFGVGYKIANPCEAVEEMAKSAARAQSHMVSMINQYEMADYDFESLRESNPNYAQMHLLLGVTKDIAKGSLSGTHAALSRLSKEARALSARVREDVAKPVFVE